MALLGQGKEGGKRTCPLERSVRSVWMSVGPGRRCRPLQCPWVCSLRSRRLPSSMSAGVIALTAECKSYTRSGEIQCEGELLLQKKEGEKYTPNAGPLPRTRSAGGACGGTGIMCLVWGPVSQPRTPSSFHSFLLFQ